MGLIDRVKGFATIRSRAKGDPVAALDAEIEGYFRSQAAAEEELRRAVAELPAMDAARDDLLLEDDAVEAIAKHDAKRAATEDTARALEIWIRSMQRRRAEAVQKRAALLVDRARAEWVREVEKLIGQMREVSAQFTRVIGIVDSARAIAGVDPKIISFFPAPPVIGNGTLIIAAEATEKFAAEVQLAIPGYVAPPPLQQAPTPAPAPPRALAAPPTPAAAQRQPRVLPAARKGSVAVTVVRSGIEFAGFQYLAGETAHIAPSEAEAALRAGAVDRIAKGSAP